MAKLVTGRTAPISGQSGFDTTKYLASAAFKYDHFTGTPTVARFFDDANNYIEFTGTGLAGNLQIGFTAGTVTAVKMVRNGATEFTATKLSLNAKQMMDHYTANQTETIWRFGLSGNDSISGTAFNDVLQGFDGNDTISGGVGTDLLVGFAGNDKLIGGAGNDRLDGGVGNDIIIGGTGGDLFFGSDGIDLADYSTSAAAINLDLATGLTQTEAGGAKGDRLLLMENITGSATAGDHIRGNGLGNVLKGLGGIDILEGRAGRDTLDGGAGGDTLNGGAGGDAANYSSSSAAVQVNLGRTGRQASGGDAKGDLLISIENLVGSKFNDTLTGNGNANTISGGKGADVMRGLGGIDLVSYASSSKGVTVNLSLSGPQVSLGDASGDVLSGFENLAGSRFADTLTGDGKNNVLTGGAGADKLNGGAGIDTASYASASKAVTVQLSGELPASFTGDAIGDTFTSIENLVGSRFDDELEGNSGSNRLTGGKGNDTFRFDSFTVDAGNDIITDFAVGGTEDGILIGYTGIFNFAAAMAKAAQVGANTVFTFDSNTTLTLLNVQKSAITEDDLIFFA